MPDLAIREETDLALSGPPSPSQWSTYMEMAKTFSNTEFVPKGLRGRPAAILACIVSGHEMGIGPMQALKHVAIVDGKPSPSAELLCALVRKEGHSITAVELTDTKAVVKGKRANNDDEHTVTWTMDDAKRAGLANKNNWKNYPRAMLWARAVSELCRILFPDCTGGATHTPEELGADVDESGQPIEVASLVEAKEHPAWLTSLVDEYGEQAVLHATGDMVAEAGGNRVLDTLDDMLELPIEWRVNLKKRLEAGSATSTEEDRTSGEGMENSVAEPQAEEVAPVTVSKDETSVSPPSSSETPAPGTPSPKGKGDAAIPPSPTLLDNDPVAIAERGRKRAAEKAKKGK